MDDYRAECRRWSEQMHRVIDEGLIPEGLHNTLLAWIARNVDEFGGPRSSGDDCHETADAQVGYCAAAGLAAAQVVWQRNMWAVL